MHVARLYTPSFLIPFFCIIVSSHSSSMFVPSLGRQILSSFSPQTLWMLASQSSYHSFSVDQKQIVDCEKQDTNNRYDDVNIKNIDPGSSALLKYVLCYDWYLAKKESECVDWYNDFEHQQEEIIYAE